jgi:hypothetical protein
VDSHEFFNWFAQIRPNSQSAFNILQLLSNHLAEQRTILKHSHKTFSSRAKKVVIRCGAGIVIAREFA